MTLSAFLATIYVPSRIELSAGYAANLAAVVKRLSGHLGRPARMADLNAAAIAGYLCEYRRQWSAVATNDNRRMLLTLWRAAWDRMMVAEPPRPGSIRRLPEEWEVPEAWNVVEIAAILEAAAERSGDVGGVPASLWWQSLLAATYWTACRIGALLRSATANYRGDTLLVRGQKNRRSQLYVLPASCCAAIDATDPHSRQQLWPWPHSSRYLFRSFRRIVERAGIPCPRTGLQLFHRLRRTSLSLCAAVDPAIAQRQAGHRNYATTLRSYIDPRLARGLTAADVLPELTLRSPIRIYG